MSFTKHSNGTYSILLGHGHLVAMASDTSGEKSFQQQAVHRIPISSKTEGWRISLTVRCLSDTINNPMMIENVTKVNLTDKCALLLFKEDFLTAGEILMLQEELLETLGRHAEPDITKMWGKTHLNQGRTVLEMAHETGLTYSYGGKTTKPGIEFPANIKQILIPKFMSIFGVAEDQLWMHAVYYPNGKCKLDWHDDGETGINPNMIASLTWLENPEQPRAFQVRLKSSFPNGFKGRKSKAKAKRKPDSNINNKVNKVAKIN